MSPYDLNSIHEPFVVPLHHGLVSLLGPRVALFNRVEGLGQGREGDVVAHQEAPEVPRGQQGIAMAAYQEPVRISQGGTRLHGLGWEEGDSRVQETCME